MAVAFLMVVGLGAYVLYCDTQNRAGERVLATESAEGGHPADPEDHNEAVATDVAASPSPARRRRTRPPADQ